ncbi:LLM class F420-dependent oxidoreductase [Fodinicola acaciae]|uniref:LLM class F420-dependent oxidoreductase n=1 Tax=Fodinicola acaciae TaxID=2681555 RepID=UPI0013D40C4B|nr:LLM class F420-dependent oxidoreductase [Fodinicola acaciae]
MELGRIGLWHGSSAAGAAADIERLGFGALWIGGADGALSEVAAALAVTSRLVVATGIVNIWRQPARTAAVAYHQVTQRHPGRVLLGIGAGHRESVDAYERPYDALSGYLDVLDAAEVPRGHRVLAALGPKVTRLAAERTAGAHPFLTTPEHTARARDVLGDRLLAPEQKVILETDAGKARAIGREALAFYLTRENYRANLLRLGFDEDDLAGGGSDRLFDATIAWGDMDTIAGRVQAHLDAGADHVAINVLTGTEDLPRKEWRELAELR